VLYRIVPLSMTLSDPEPQNGLPDPLHGFRVGGSNGAICGSIKSKIAADGHLGHTQMAINDFATGLPVDVMFGSRVGFPAELIDFYHRGFHTRTEVARKPCAS